MLFINNKYTHWYNTLIKNAQARNLTSRSAAKQVLGYVELHHIIPRSLNGSNSCENVVFLTANEHFVCHRMLVRMLTGANQAKMAKAVHRMTTSNKFQTRIKISGKLYDQIRREAGAAHSIMMTGRMTGSSNPFYNKTHSDATKATIGAKNKGRLIGVSRSPKSIKQGADKLRGKAKSEAHKQATRDTWDKEARAGVNHPMFNKTHTEKTVQLMQVSAAARWTDEYKMEFREKIKNRPVAAKMVCPHCGKSADPGNYKQWHGDACKNNK